MTKSGPNGENSVVIVGPPTDCIHDVIGLDFAACELPKSFSTQPVQNEFATAVSFNLPEHNHHGGRLFWDGPVDLSGQTTISLIEALTSEQYPRGTWSIISEESKASMNKRALISEVWTKDGGIMELGGRGEGRGGMGSVRTEK